MTDIGSRIKEIREDFKLTQEQFREKIGLKKSSVSGVEKDKQGISDSVTKLITKEFCVNEKWLLNGIEEKYHYISNNVSIGEKIRQLRKNEGLTQQELADKTGISRGHISRIESVSNIPKEYK
jgi:transcriptional regulator with XRE-family HTH domain